MHGPLDRVLIHTHCIPRCDFVQLAEHWPEAVSITQVNQSTHVLWATQYLEDLIQRLGQRVLQAYHILERLLLLLLCHYNVFFRQPETVAAVHRSSVASSLASTSTAPTQTTGTLETHAERQALMTDSMDYVLPILQRIGHIQLVRRIEACLLTSRSLTLCDDDRLDGGHGWLAVPVVEQHVAHACIEIERPVACLPRHLTRHLVLGYGVRVGWNWTLKNKHDDSISPCVVERKHPLFLGNVHAQPTADRGTHRAMHVGEPASVASRDP